jgi:hypothetical protein
MATVQRTADRYVKATVDGEGGSAQLAMRGTLVPEWEFENGGFQEIFGWYSRFLCSYLVVPNSHHKLEVPPKISEDSVAMTTIQPDTPTEGDEMVTFDGKFTKKVSYDTYPYLRIR